jgi:RNA polymerase sigma-70 factor (ECF subfamily)
MSEPEVQGSDSWVIGESLADPAVFAVLFDRHYEPIWRYACRRVGPAIADEVASETFLRAFAARERYDRGRLDAGPWLYGIATNLLRGHRRGEARRMRAYARAAESAETHGGLDGIEQRVDAGARAPAVAAALASLKPADRDAVLLLALADLGYEGIAIATGVPVGTVRSRLSRARRQLQRELGLAPASADGTAERSRR